MVLTFEEWQEVSFSGGLGGGKLIARKAWEARQEEIDALTLDLATARANLSDLEGIDKACDAATQHVLLLQADLQGAQVAQALLIEKAAAIAHSEKDGDNRVIENRILALTPAPAAAALRVREAEIRLEEAKIAHGEILAVRNQYASGNFLNEGAALEQANLEIADRVAELAITRDKAIAEAGNAKHS